MIFFVCSLCLFLISFSVFPFILYTSFILYDFFFFFSSFISAFCFSFVISLWWAAFSLLLLLLLLSLFNQKTFFFVFFLLFLLIFDYIFCLFIFYCIIIIIVYQAVKKKNIVLRKSTSFRCSCSLYILYLQIKQAIWRADLLLLTKRLCMCLWNLSYTFLFPSCLIFFYIKHIRWFFFVSRLMIHH